MKTKNILLAFVMAASSFAIAGNNPTSRWRVSSVTFGSVLPSTRPNLDCPKSFCREPDNGWSWKAWCESHKSQMPSTYTVGVTSYNGTTCGCPCFGSIED